MQAFEAFYAEHHSWLRTWLARRMGHSADAADLAHDTFVKVIRSRHVDAVRQPRDFLTVVARGLMVDLFRRRALEKAYLDALAVRSDVYAPSPDESAAALEALIALDAMLAGMGRNVRRAFLWSQCDGLTYAQIAQRLGVSLRTVHTYMARAMEQCCRARLAQSGEGADAMPVGT
ncbi:sigma-70 family RNA polymerase sigma factor [Dyella sp. 20L07]|uniref:sigma-70 family RNA polymerase sigma factor n=1 Tax=Dyella sp. 20L07 TaxID=3384240 RepID=UPI003D2DF165